MNKIKTIKKETHHETIRSYSLIYCIIQVMRYRTNKYPRLNLYIMNEIEIM